MTTGSAVSAISYHDTQVELTINVSKSHYMIFHRRRKKVDINDNPSLNNTVLQKVNCTKFWGVIIDDGLKNLQTRF